MLKKFKTDSHIQKIQRRIRDKREGRRLAIESAKFESEPEMVDRFMTFMPDRPVIYR